MEKHLKSAMHIADMLNDASIDSVLAIDTQWQIIAWNKTTENISGINKRDALGRHLMEIFPQINADEEMLTAYGMALEGKKSFLPAKAGLFNRAHYENHFIPLQDGDGNIVGVMNLMHDVAHRIKAEMQLQHLNAQLKEKYQQLEKANAELATFTAITGNDLKEPLKKVYTSLEMIVMNDGARLSDSSKAGLRRMQASLNRVKLLLDDILAISTASSYSGEYTQVDLNQVMRTVQVSLRNKIKESEANIHVDQLPSVLGYEEMLRNLFYNLLDNAIKFQPFGNTPAITISAQTVQKPAANELPSGPQKDYVALQFRDNGIGFSAEDNERIFTMFEKLNARTDYPGSGIGLTVCRKIVEAHGGYIEARGEPGKGATFTCYLPI
jgi:PAS domain S-box-containing protein